MEGNGVPLVVNFVEVSIAVSLLIFVIFSCLVLLSSDFIFLSQYIRFPLTSVHFSVLFSVSCFFTLLVFICIGISRFVFFVFCAHLIFVNLLVSQVLASAI